LEGSIYRQEDSQLVEELQAGAPGAFERFVAIFRPKIFQYTWVMCRQREDAEEVSQETLLRALQSFGQLREGAQLRPWIFRIARNACLIKRRKSVFAPAQELSLDALMPSFEHNGGERKLQIADWSQEPERLALRGELKAALEVALAELPDTYKPVVLLRDVEGLSTQETAEVLELSEDVVKQRLHRGRLALRQKLDGFMQASNQQESRKRDGV
jgi:RNA polymerase sigma-70 factor, ECF subfamily